MGSETKNMRYGFFDNEHREYVITRPDTPAPWVNYLGSPEYGAIISNNAGGYSFEKSGANGRILRYHFNQDDTPGRYIYIRDNDTKDFWSASWQPVGKDLSGYTSRCCHGTGYTRILAEYAQIRSEAVYYVPQGKRYEVWELCLENASDQRRELTVTGYAEFTSHSNYEQDQVNLQYSLFITRTFFEKNRIMQQVHGNLSGSSADESTDEKNVQERFFGLAGAQAASYCGERDAFLGKYHSYADPDGVIRGDLGNVLNYNENSCGALSAVVTLAPGERKTICFLAGAKDSEEAGRLLDGYEDPSGRCAAEVQELKDFWHGIFSRFQIRTPSEEMNSMMNTWHAYNCFMTFIWSRAASFIYCGLRNGYGYRDTVQDIQGIIHLSPEMAKEKIRFMLSAQTCIGGGLPLVKYTHRAGYEDTPDEESYRKETGHPSYRADDALWLFPTIYKYIAETGDLDFIDEIVPYADYGEATVYEHLKQAIDFTMNHLGPHGMPAGLYADWNDCLRLGKDGESVFVAMQFYDALKILKQFAVLKEEEKYRAYLEKEAGELKEVLCDLCWDKDRFIRGFSEQGEIIGLSTDPEANMWLNPQSWAVISELADAKQTERALGAVREHLNTEYGAMLMAPPYHAHAFEGALSVIYNPGSKENAGIFSQPQGWIVLAEALAGHGDRAFSYYRESCPAVQNDQAEIRKLEPYCFGQFTEGPDSAHFGRSHVHWLTGTAATMMVGCVEGILGMRPDFYGLRIAPSIPKSWEGFEIDREFRGKHLHIKVKNPAHKETGAEQMYLNGRKMKDPYIPADMLEQENEIELIL